MSIQLRDDKIILDGKFVGRLHFLTYPNWCIRYLEHNEDRNVFKTCGVNLPKVFNYVWIEDLFVKPDFRRQGIARKAIELLEKPNTLIALFPGNALRKYEGLSHHDRISMYKRLGFNFHIGKDASGEYNYENRAYKFIPPLMSIDPISDVASANVMPIKKLTVKGKGMKKLQSKLDAEYAALITAADTVDRAEGADKREADSKKRDILAKMKEMLAKLFICF